MRYTCEYALILSWLFLWPVTLNSFATDNVIIIERNEISFTLHANHCGSYLHEHQDKEIHFSNKQVYSFIKALSGVILCGASSISEKKI